MNSKQNSGSGKLMTGNGKVIFVNEERIVAVQSETNILSLALKNKIAIDNSCGGSGSCGTCRVIVQNPDLASARTEVEQAMAEDRGFAQNERLACQLEPTDGLRIQTFTSNEHKSD